MPTRVPTSLVAVEVEQDVAGLGRIEQREGGAGNRAQPPPAIEAEAGVVAALSSGVGNVDEAAGDGDAHRVGAL